MARSSLLIVICVTGSKAAYNIRIWARDGIDPESVFYIYLYSTVQYSSSLLNTDTRSVLQIMGI